MKKWICIVLPIILFSICGCEGRKTGIIPLTKGISFTADIVYYNECYECHVTIDSQGVMTAEVIQPSDISGLVISCSENGVSAEFKGLKYDFKSGTQPLGGICGAVYDAIKDTWEKQGQVFLENERYYIKGKNKTDNYTIYLGETGLPLTLEIPDESFMVTFKSVTILDT